MFMEYLVIMYLILVVTACIISAFRKK